MQLSALLPLWCTQGGRHDACSRSLLASVSLYRRAARVPATAGGPNPLPGPLAQEHLQLCVQCTAIKGARIAVHPATRMAHAGIAPQQDAAFHAAAARRRPLAAWWIGLGHEQGQCRDWGRAHQQSHQRAIQRQPNQPPRPTATGSGRAATPSPWLTPPSCSPLASGGGLLHGARRGAGRRTASHLSRLSWGHPDARAMAARGLLQRRAAPPRRGGWHGHPGPAFVLLPCSSITCCP